MNMVSVSRSLWQPAVFPTLLVTTWLCCVATREEIEKQKSKERYMKLHLEGKTEQARADLARLAIIKKQREDAAKKRDELRKGERTRPWQRPDSAGLVTLAGEGVIELARAITSLQSLSCLK